MTKAWIDNSRKNTRQQITTIQVQVIGVLLKCKIVIMYTSNDLLEKIAVVLGKLNKLNKN